MYHKLRPNGKVLCMSMALPVKARDGCASNNAVRILLRYELSVFASFKWKAGTNLRSSRQLGTKAGSEVMTDPRWHALTARRSRNPAFNYKRGLTPSCPFEAKPTTIKAKP